jgi:DNA-directed RNA polymerase subunit RPC12/RpoP
LAKIVEEIRCSNCGAPLNFKPGEIVVTCKYCGFTVVIATREAFILEHSLIVNKCDELEVERVLRSWMNSGFLKPKDLGQKAKIVEKELQYLPFWIVTISASTHYRGVFERITPPVAKEGSINKSYDWIVLGRKASRFPTREYQIPIEGKILFDFRQVDRNAKVLNSELTEGEVIDEVKEEVESNHRFLASKDVDRLIEFKSDFDIGKAVYVHAPIWFIVYEYNKKYYNIILDGATGQVIKGDIPPMDFGLF